MSMFYLRLQVVYKILCYFKTWRPLYLMLNTKLMFLFWNRISFRTRHVLGNSKRSQQSRQHCTCTMMRMVTCLNNKLVNMAEHKISFLISKQVIGIKKKKSAEHPTLELRSIYSTLQYIRCCGNLYTSTAVCINTITEKQFQ